MLFRMHREPVGDRAGHIGRRHQRLVRIALEAAAVAAAMIDEVDPGLRCAVALGGVERAVDEVREIFARRRIVGRTDVNGAVDLAVADVVGLGALAAVLNCVAARGGVFDRKGDVRIVRADAERLIDDRRLHGVEIVIAVAIESELQCGDVHAALLRRIGDPARGPAKRSKLEY